MNNGDLFFNVTLVGRTSESLDEDKLNSSLARFSNHRLSFRKFSPPPGCTLPLNPRAHYTIDNWTRLWVEEFFPPTVDRVLYLDTDIVVVDSIAPLWYADLEGMLFGAVDIPGAQQASARLGLPPEEGYFNSGVLLVDLKQWRETHALQRVLEYVAAYPERMVYTLDQEALNGCFHDSRRRLDYIWNATWPFFQEPPLIPLTREEIEAVRREARIIHFSGLKPWSYFCDHPRRAEYQKYLQMTEWRDFVPPDRTLVNVLRKRLSPILPSRAKQLLKAVAQLSRISGDDRL